MFPVQQEPEEYYRNFHISNEGPDLSFELLALFLSCIHLFLVCSPVKFTTSEKSIPV